MATSKREREGFGSRLRQLRKRSGWTLNQVSSMSGLAISTLSKVENNQISLTYDNLLKLAHGLGLNIAELFGSEDVRVTGGRRTITRNGEAKQQMTANYDYHFHGTELLDMHMTPMFISVKARSREDFGELLQHPGEEFIYVLEGTIEVFTEFYEPVRLDVGESIYLDSTMAHGYISVGSGEASILGICSSTIPELMESAAPTVGGDNTSKSGGNR